MKLSLISNVLFISSLSMLFSCGAGHHLRMADKHIKKAIEKGAVIKDDTVHKEITLKTKPLKIEWEPKLISLNDTVYYEQKIPNSDLPVKIKIIYRTTESGITAQPSIEVPETKHIQSLPVAIKRKVEPPPEDRKWRWLGIGFFSGVIATLSIIIKRR